MPIKFLVLGFFIGEGVGKCRFYFYGLGDFSEHCKVLELSAVKELEMFHEKVSGAVEISITGGFLLCCAMAERATKQTLP